MIAGLFALLVFALLRTPAIAARTGFPPDQFPVAAAAEVEKLAPTARILAPDGLVLGLKIDKSALPSPS